MSAPDKIPEPNLSDRILDRYHLLHRIGVGGMGAVYEAEHTRLRKRFAVKLLRHELATNEISRKRFLREARAASAVSHPHVVAISDFGETDEGHVFFVMELLDGKDLHDVLEAERALPWPRTREILLQVTSALQAAHQLDIIHRDIKPSNVFLVDVPGKGDEDFVKVLDFGIAKLSGNLGEATAKLTSTDEIFGTVAYMAPEMVVGKNDDPRSDMYAVGVMMYRMLTGALPYTEGNAFQILSQHINAPIPSVREKNPAISEVVEAIVQRAMAKQPSDRFATMEEFNRALRRGMLEATEVPAVALAARLVEAAREPLAEVRPRPDIDERAPVPTQGMGAPALTDAAAVPRIEQTVVSTSIVVDPSGSIGVPLREVEPTVVFDSGSIGRPAPDHAVLPEPADLEARDEPRRSSMRFVLPIVGLVAAGVIAFTMLGGSDDGAGAKTPVQAVASILPEAKPKPDAKDLEPARQGDAPETLGPEPKPAADDGDDEPEPAADDGGDEPEPAHAGADGSESKAEPKPAADPEPPKPTKSTTTLEPSSTKPSSTKPSSTKPKSDKEVVAGLAAKIASKCKGQSSGKVKVEGLISASGKVENLLVTPQGGLGSCEKRVKGAKFDPQGGVRPMPRFTVEL
ncbi:serine/threonine-protein kinase [Paraliomyxa miuraensis]|uniref:serine/threonine-protein kinase n=1 Tax=Paraliomyxa miuraensis TaxID=376150 RepID=UPI002259A23C|nr:serine/threonine-protein kinase [Paraliomyxa miuraensis]MCX4241741.1 protein kinase [Paraliomyxa miuraensis]